MPSEHSAGSPAGSSVDFEKVGSDYFQQRELKKGAAGWVLLVGLGVAYVISGDYDKSDETLKQIEKIIADSSAAAGTPELSEALRALTPELERYRVTLNRLRTGQEDALFAKVELVVERDVVQRHRTFLCVGGFRSSSLRRVRRAVFLSLAVRSNEFGGATPARPGGRRRALRPGFLTRPWGNPASARPAAGRRGGRPGRD